MWCSVCCHGVPRMACVSHGVPRMVCISHGVPRMVCVSPHVHHGRIPPTCVPCDVGMLDVLRKLLKVTRDTDVPPVLLLRTSDGGTLCYAPHPRPIHMRAHTHFVG